MVLRILLCMVVFGTMLAGCSKDEATAPTETKFTGTSFMRAKVGAMDFKCNSLMDMATEVTPDPTVIDAGDGKLFIQIAGGYYSMGGTAHLDITAMIEPTSGKQYTFGEVGTDNAVTVLYNDGNLDNSGYFYTSPNSGTITIDHIDTSAKRIAGRFTATAKHADTDKTTTVEVTNGTFEIGY